MGLSALLTASFGLRVEAVVGSVGGQDAAAAGPVGGQDAAVGPD